ncbi:MAG: putative cytosolic protein [Parcubacteria group bacterium GW2011_GWC1_43_11b]|nr:MAG: putative cytosolic protein [Parcubacteria group bacterium GW2011_GWC1_43_11b]
MCIARYDICMLSVERVKELINDPNLSDKEIEEIRDGLFMLAEVMFEQWQAERIKAKKENDNQNEHEKPSGQQQ